MRLVKISNYIDDYLNTDFIIRIWKQDDKWYCLLLNDTTYQISKDMANKLLNYD